MNKIRRAIAAVLAAVMVMAMGTMVFADDSVNASEIPLTKSIVMFNTEGSLIREPNISFTYTVAPADPASAKVTDANGVSVTVNKGVENAFPGSLNLSFSSENEKQSAAAAGTEVEKSGKLNIDLNVFDHAGIYRYVITEAEQNVEAAGLDAHDGYINTRYMDVYITNTEDGGLGLLTAVIFKNIEANDNITAETAKTTGFEPGSDDYENDATVDKYHTFNLEVGKKTTGGLADLKNKFPFEITLTGDKAAAITADYDNGSAEYEGTAPATISISSEAAVLLPKMANNDSVKVIGLPVGTKVQVKETNNTPDQYKAAISEQTGFEGLELDKENLANKESAQLKEAAEVADKTQNSKIELTNTIETISPTGVVMRFAPYILILASGIAILVISRRRRVTE